MHPGQVCYRSFAPTLLLGMGLFGLNRAAAQTLAQALDTSNLIWTSGGNADWTFQTALTHDGSDAAQSGTVTHNQESWVRTSVNGPGMLTFWWRISSEPDYDNLELWVDDLNSLSISGESGWLKVTNNIADGTHTINWRYAKDLNLSVGADRAWLDEVSFITPPPSAPEITTQPTNQTVGAGADALLAVTATGFPFPEYQWWFAGSPIAGGTNSSLAIPNVGLTEAGDYTVVVSNSLGVVTGGPAHLAVITLGEGLDRTNLVWTTGGARGWHAEVGVTHDGADAAQSALISESQESWVQTSLTGAGTLTFWWKVSSESNAFGFGGDALEFYLDGVLRSNVLGEVGWQLQSYALTQGVHTLRWRYLKDSSVSVGQDRGWVDEVQFTTESVPQPFALGIPVILQHGSAQFALFGELGRNYTIQAATNLGMWSDLTNFLMSDTNIVQIVDPNATNFPRRFYRGIALP